MTDVITGNQQFDFQIHRFTMNFLQNKDVQSDLKNIAKDVTDFATWTKWWSKRAEYYEEEDEYAIAASYYKAAMFYLFENTKQKVTLYNDFIRCFYQSYNDFDYERYQVPYEGGTLPALLLKQPQATKTLLVIGGFDGYLEELTSFYKYMKGTNYNIIIFDGPGQGNTSSQGLHFIHNFEKPVSVILDYFKLSEVDAIGMSWGGYLVMRAAAFEKRIKKVIALDVFYTPMDTVKMNLGLFKFGILSGALLLHQKKTLNRLLSKAAQNNIDLQWKLGNGYLLTGTNTPYDFLQDIKKHNASHILKYVNQDCLLLAGENDQYVPVKRLKTIREKLVNAGEIRTKLFTKETGADQHCQVGRVDLAFDEIKSFLAD
ncbi:alpha beta fold family hydrolase [Levilactobacillus paucivorans]|uniref:Alpha beta fold family hydrolase n=1 Tax=Levilactobacillus paucivorans TaxID=616990 RepID=A0A0R2LW87_9LACO|nr:alpha/beta hydrolase [Levilactobacillus paucivorans]KRO03872.1 alpha beta fold family hydrolase [Levilactobacillus paucivorans]